MASARAREAEVPSLSLSPRSCSLPLSAARRYLARRRPLAATPGRDQGPIRGPGEVLRGGRGARGKGDDEGPVEKTRDWRVGVARGGLRKCVVFLSVVVVTAR